MASSTSSHSRGPIRVVLSSTGLLPFLSVRKAAALAIAQLGFAAFFVGGIAGSIVGASAAWFVLMAAVAAMLVRAIEIENWALLVPGGLVGRVRSAFGPRAARVAAAVSLIERFLFAALASVVVGHYVAAVGGTAIAGWRYTGYLQPEDLATVVAVAAIGLLWIRGRIGRDLDRDLVTRGIWIGITVLVVLMTWGPSR